MANINITTEEMQALYLNGEDTKIISELFGEDEKYFNFETYKKKSGWNNKGFNPLHQLMDLAEFITAATDGHDEVSKAELYREVVDNFVAD